MSGEESKSYSREGLPWSKRVCACLDLNLPMKERAGPKVRNAHRGLLRHSQLSAASFCGSSSGRQHEEVPRLHISVHDAIRVQLMQGLKHPLRNVRKIRKPGRGLLGLTGPIEEIALGPLCMRLVLGEKGEAVQPVCSG